MLRYDRSLVQEAGVKLRKLREQLNYSLKEMAVHLGVTRAAYWKNENGESFPGYQSLRRLSEVHDISMDWFIFNKGPMYGQEKGRDEELEELKKELALEREKNAGMERKREMELKPELKELVAHMDRIPVLYHDVLLRFQKFILENKELVETSMNRNPIVPKAQPGEPSNGDEQGS